MKRILISVILCCILTLMIGCGYSLKGSGSFLPAHIKKIALQEFGNRTSRLDLEKIIFEKLQDELISRGGYEIVSDTTDADASLEGEIIEYQTVPKSVDAEGRATSYMIRITVSVRLRDLKKETVLFEDSNYRFTEEYQLSSSEEDFFEQEEFALQEAAAKFAEELISTILEGF